ncbi:hypothetical protein [Variovorax arabinosiphilus]|uniref:hypothetical protein n=1 Tax=Variovorax arabinosiphilus TaxID=3053498 RepID=UPI0025785776|nr:hypothetical protein [Variovorax sp. J2R1-6]MDM0235058.1 hypothetical protein [Variovorax sp. J2R1-6]
MSRVWHKLGQLFSPQGSQRHPKLLTHAANPLPVQLDGDVYRVFFSGRDALNRSSVGAVDIDIVKRHVVKEHHAPFFEHGPVGSFYADGVSIGNCYDTPSGRYMLFMGWRSPENAHWRGEVGRLRVAADLTLSLDGDRPFMPLDDEDAVSLSYPWVQQDDEKNGYAMWYGSTLTWNAGNGEMVHVIKRASSNDGEHWHKEGLAVPYAVGVAQAFSRPTVFRDSSGLHMWFSFRSGAGEAYRIGYASSLDGRAWDLRPDAVGIDVSNEGWDSEMIEYPFVLEHRGERYMLYNGNGYGKTGFGLAMLTG